MSELEKYWRKHLSTLIGGTIESVEFDSDEGFPVFVVAMPNGVKKTCWILRDPEGNGGGFLDIIDN